ncbi:hypothetical protein [Nocardia thailandica]
MLNRPTTGELTALVVTQAGDLLCEIRFEVHVDRRARPLTLLVMASDAFMPVSPDETARLRALVRGLDIRW